MFMSALYSFGGHVGTQSVKYPTLNLGSGHDLTVVRQSPWLGSMLGVEPAWDSLTLRLSLSLCPSILSK